MTAMISLQTAEIDPNVVKPGWIALLIVLALGAVTVLLWLSMRKQLRRIDVDGAGADGPARSGDPASPDNSPSPAGDAAPKTSETPTTSTEAKEHTSH
ncbi:hypothetical protein [Kribbella solani]|uniref:Uncharacterized protein n=1 Tax=Kribbella solani TaxID=236067 RepID=A0A841E4X1_9ACTN|nr:hypothetical protein [Kribbella solani]MBB5983427.1 hypothetical protein [Kribbella solani]